MDECIFCKIVKGQIPSFKLAENDEFLAFLSIGPLKPGHTLVIPKEHSGYIFDARDQILSKLLLFAKPIAKKLEMKLKPSTGKVGLIVAGLEVLHTHLHLVPMDAESDLNFKNAKQATMEELEQVLDKINS